MKNFFKNKNARIILWVAIVVVIALFFWLTMPKSASKTQPSGNVNNALQPAGNNPAAVNGNTNKPTIGTPAKKPAVKPVGFVEKRTPHFVSSSIANNATITQVPSFLTLTFDAPLAKSTQSILSVKKDDVTSATVAPSSINDKQLVVQLNTQVTDGNYYVYYVACFADTGCKDGRLGYHVNLP